MFERPNLHPFQPQKNNNNNLTYNVLLLIFIFVLNTHVRRLIGSYFVLFPAAILENEKTLDLGTRLILYKLQCFTRISTTEKCGI